MSEYDHSIHMNPDAKTWAEFFMKTKEENNWSLEDVDEELMIGWFANAMMAMHDHLYNEKLGDIKQVAVDQFYKELMRSEYISALGKEVICSHYLLWPKQK